MFSILLSCTSENDTNKLYNEKYYQKVSILDKDSFSVNEGYEVLVYLFDTSRKMMKYYWDNGTIQAIGFYYKGQKEGKWTSYFEDGNLATERFFVNGNKEGKHKVYFSNGKLSIVENYKQGAKIGDWFYYDTLGKLIRTEHY